MLQRQLLPRLHPQSCILPRRLLPRLPRLPRLPPRGRGRRMPHLPLPLRPRRLRRLRRQCRLGRKRRPRALYPWYPLRHSTSKGRICRWFHWQRWKSSTSCALLNWRATTALWLPTCWASAVRPCGASSGNTACSACGERAFSATGLPRHEKLFLRPVSATCVAALPAGEPACFQNRASLKKVVCSVCCPAKSLARGRAFVLAQHKKIPEKLQGFFAVAVLPRQKTERPAAGEQRCPFPLEEIFQPRHLPGAGKSCGEGSMFWQRHGPGAMTTRPLCRKVLWRCCWRGWRQAQFPDAGGHLHCGQGR